MLKSTFETAYYKNLAFHQAIDANPSLKEQLSNFNLKNFFTISASSTSTSTQKSSQSFEKLQKNYLEYWRSLIDEEQVSAREDMEVLQKSFQDLKRDQQSITGLKHDGTIVYMCHKEITLKVPTSVNSNVIKPGATVTVYDNGPRNEYYKANHKIPVFTGYVKSSTTDKLVLLVKELDKEMPTNKLTIVKRPNGVMFTRYEDCLKKINDILESENHFMKNLYKILSCSPLNPSQSLPVSP